jgi:hypothetical protein
LAADHAVRTDRFGQLCYEHGPDQRVAVRILVRQYLERKRLQGVPGQNGRRLVELLVAGRPAAPQIIVVHGRQVVVDQGICMHQFNRARGT